MSADRVHPEILGHLGRGEQVLWWDRSRQAHDRSPESIAIAAGVGLAIIATGLAIAMLTGLVTPDFQYFYLFVWLSAIAYGVFRMAADRAARRGESLFAITNDRLLFFHWRRSGGRTFRTLALTETLFPNASVDASGSGSITFKPDVRWRQWDVPPEAFQFYDIADARAVHAIYERAAREARARP